MRPESDLGVTEAWSTDNDPTQRTTCPSSGATSM